MEPWRSPRRKIICRNLWRVIQDKIEPVLKDMSLVQKKWNVMIDRGNYVYVAAFHQVHKTAIKPPQQSLGTDLM